MADSKITDLSQLSGAPANTDVLPLVDVSDTSMAASGTTKKITVADLLTNVARTDQSNTFTTQQLFAAGSVGAPSISIDGDADTGLYRPAADILALTVGGVEALRVLEGGGDTTTYIGDLGYVNFDEGQAPSSRALGVVTNLDGHGLIVKERDSGNGTGVFFGVYNRHGTPRFEVTDSVINLNSQVQLATQSRSGTYNVVRSSPGFYCGTGQGGTHPLTLQKNNTNPDSGLLLALDVRHDTSGSRGVRAGELVHYWIDSTETTYKAGFSLLAFDYNGSREALKYEADGTQPLIGFLGASAVSQQTRAGQITDNSGGSVDGTVAAVSGSGDDATINNNLADILDRLNKLEDQWQKFGFAS